MTGSRLAAQHGPERPAIIAHRYECPSCGALAGDPCVLILNGQRRPIIGDVSHEARHQAASRAAGQALRREIDAGTSPVLSIRVAR